METKKCTKCLKELPATTQFFFRHLRTKCGLHPYCKPCRKIADKEYKERRKKLGIEKRKKEYDSYKAKARNEAMSAYGSAKGYNCSVLSCRERANDLHHVSYKFPLDVIPLCRKHHEQEHHKY